MEHKRFFAKGCVHVTNSKQRKHRVALNARFPVLRKKSIQC